jgi:hypothetical protein
MGMTMRMAVIVGMGRNHQKMLYYNTGGVYKPKRQLEFAAGRVANSVNDKLSIFGLVEDHIRVRMRDGSAETGPIRRPPAVRMLGENINGRMYPLLDVLGAAR